MVSHGENVLPKDGAKDFYGYVDLLKPITALYDRAVEDTTEDDHGMAMTNMTALRKCQRLSFALLKDMALPPEIRLILYYYMAAGQDETTTVLYLRQALDVVEFLEFFTGEVDPMREILERDLKDVENAKKRSSCADQFGTLKNKMVDRSVLNNGVPQTQNRQSLGSSSSTHHREEPESYHCYTCEHRNRIISDAEAEPTDPGRNSSEYNGGRVIPSSELEDLFLDDDDVDDSFSADIDDYHPGSDNQSSSSSPASHHLGDGLVSDEATLTQNTDLSSTTTAYGMDVHGATYDQPSIILTDADEPDSPTVILHRAQDENFRRQLHYLEMYADVADEEDDDITYDRLV